MKILLICPEEIFGERWGGVSTYTVLQAEALTKLGCQVTVLTPGNRERKLTMNGYTIFKLNSLPHLETKSILFQLVRKTINLVRKYLSKSFPDFINRLEWSFKVACFVQTKQFNIIEAPEWGSSTIFVSLFLRIKVVVQLHRSWYFYKKDNNLPFTFNDRLIFCLEFLSILFANSITSPSHFMLSQYKYLMPLLKLRKVNYKVIPYGIEIVNLKKNRLTKLNYILTVGRIEKAKGSFTVIQAFEKIQKRFNNLKLFLIGEDTEMFIDDKITSYKKFLFRYIYSHGLQKHISIFPRLKRYQLRPYFNNCLFYIMPSGNNENLPFALLEALSCKKALIGSDTGGIPEIIKNNINGLLFKSGSVNDLTEKMEFMLHNPHFRKSCEIQNTKDRNKYSLKKSSSFTLKNYHELLDEPVKK